MGLSLKNSISFISILLIGLNLWFCKNENAKVVEDTTTDKNCVNLDLNPNGSSELSLLMRDMLNHAESMKESVLAGKWPSEFPEKFKEIHTAIPTDEFTKRNTFDGFAKNYLDCIKALNEMNQGNLIEKYNNVIQACESCHSEHCPGPLKIIRKLKIN
ncbi:MAG: hypothetical protein IPM51_01445 [Sphingobacteriaceae bacterium]|nr:hypothetical protein [Sphingobacteriaceae bacterium]